MEQTPKKAARSPIRHAPGPDPRLTLRSKTFPLSCMDDTEKERFEIRFLENVLTDDPCNEEALMLLGFAYTQSGDYERGLNMDQRLVRLKPDDATAYYNLACSYSLLKRGGEAFTCLEKAIMLGYHNLGHILKDPDLEHLRQDSNFRAFVARLLRQKASNS